MNDLLKDLADGERRNRHNRIPDPCSVCELLANPALTDAEKIAIRSALGGTIGTNRLSKILTKNGWPVSDRKIRAHRAESEPAK